MAEQGRPVYYSGYGENWDAILASDTMTVIPFFTSQEYPRRSVGVATIAGTFRSGRGLLQTFHLKSVEGQIELDGE